MFHVGIIRSCMQSKSGKKTDKTQMVCLSFYFAACQNFSKHRLAFFSNTHFDLLILSVCDVIELAAASLLHEASISTGYATVPPSNSINTEDIDSRMRSIKITLFLVSLVVGTNGFVVPSPMHTVSQTQRTETQLHLMDPLHSLGEVMSSLSIADAADGVPGESTYSRVSYYTVLGLYVMSFPGIWSQVKRSTSAKVKRKTYISPGENAKDGKDLRQQAGEIMACEYTLPQTCCRSMCDQ